MTVKLNYMAIPGVSKLTNRERAKFVRVFDPEIVIKASCAYYDKPIEELQTKSRKRELVVPRQVIMYFLSEYTDMTYLAIGKIFNRDHTTAMYSKDNVKDLMTTDDDFKGEIDELKSLIAGSH